MILRIVLALALSLLPAVGSAADLQAQKIADGIWAIVGEKLQRSPQNLANNATFGLVETADGAVLVDPGGSWNGAAALHRVIKDLTDAKVRYVVNTGGQDHRWLGNGYWKAQGAQVIASAAAVEDQAARGSMQLTMLAQLIGDGLKGTEPEQADIAFEEMHVLEFGGRRLEIHHHAAHTPGDSFVWLPRDRVVFTGDIVYVERVLGVMDFSDSAAWLEAFAALEALEPRHIVPGHGSPTTLERARADTRDYLLNLRQRMREHIDGGGDIIGAVDVDQSAFSRLGNFESLAKRNAQTVFQQMEWE